MKLDLTQQQLFLLYYIHKGYLKPVDKLLNCFELYEVLDNYTYKGSTYSLPYLFFVNEDYYSAHKLECYYRDAFVCDIEVEEYYVTSFKDLALKIFGVNTKEHPGVRDLYTNIAKYIVGGEIHNFSDTAIRKLEIPYITHTLPKQPTSYVFQSRNPPHKAHENIVQHYSQKGSLLYTTPYSTTKVTDYSFATKIKCYEKMKELYDVDLLVTLLPRVFAGPREALQNCLLFKNLGYTHFIMGRGKNCVGNFYGQKESYEFCKKFESRIGLFIEYESTQFHKNVELKASSIKSEYINEGIIPPSELMNPAIAEILLHNA